MGANLGRGCRRFSLADFSRLPVCHRLQLVGGRAPTRSSRLEPDFLSGLQTPNAPSDIFPGRSAVRLKPAARSPAEAGSWKQPGTTAPPAEAGGKGRVG